MNQRRIFVFQNTTSYSKTKLKLSKHQNKRHRKIILKNIINEAISCIPPFVRWVDYYDVFDFANQERIRDLLKKA